jgi:hypothetical protein
MTVRFLKPFDAATLSMCCFCVRLFEKAVMLELGKISAKYRDAEPHPHLRY